MHWKTDFLHIQVEWPKPDKDNVIHMDWYVQCRVNFYITVSKLFVHYLEEAHTIIFWLSTLLNCVFNLCISLFILFKG